MNKKSSCIFRFIRLVLRHEKINSRSFPKFCRFIIHFYYVMHCVVHNAGRSEKNKSQQAHTTKFEAVAREGNIYKLRR